MTRLKQLESGLVVPVDPPKPKPTRLYGPLEIQDEQCREEAKDGLIRLWKAMELGRGNSSIGGNSNYEAHWQAYHYLAKMLLGSDAPDFEVLT